jgi:hypothetical protein
MDMKCNKSKIKININNDELLKTIWEHTKKIKMGRVSEENIIKLINLHLLYHIILNLFSSQFQYEALIKNLKIYLAIKIHFINPKCFFPPATGFW